MPEEDTKAKTPPYASYRTLVGFLETLRSSSGIPSRIDRSLLPTMSGTAQSQIMGALAFFGLIDDAATGNTLPDLNRLVHATGDERKAILKELVTKAYPYLTDGTLNLKTATPKQVEDALKDATGITGDTIRKCFVFFVTMARDAGLELSSFLAGTRGRNGAARRRSGSRSSPQPETDEEPEVEDEYEEPGESIPVPDGFLIHHFQLRRDLIIQVALPQDITAKDVVRLNKLLQVLPMEDEPDVPAGS